MNCCEERLCVYHKYDTLAWKGIFKNIGYDVNDSEKVIITGKFYTKQEEEDEPSEVVATVTPDAESNNAVYITAQSDNLRPGELFIRVFINVLEDSYTQNVVAHLGTLKE